MAALYRNTRLEGTPCGLLMLARTRLETVVMPRTLVLQDGVIIEYMETRCARCYAFMTCDPKGDCWCAELPHGPMTTKTEGCLCLGCLSKELHMNTQQGIGSLQPPRRSMDDSSEATTSPSAVARDGGRNVQTK